MRQRLHDFNVLSYPFKKNEESAIHPIKMNKLHFLLILKHDENAECCLEQP
jgi:hypothetical protein